jgi:hypothetical protein
LSSMGFSPWLFGRASWLVAPSYLILSHFSACSVVELKIGCQSSIEESASKMLVQRVLVLLSWIVQYGGGEALKNSAERSVKVKGEDPFRWRTHQHICQWWLRRNRSS